MSPPNQRDASRFPSVSSTRRVTLALLAICILSLALYVRQARTWNLGYDEAWHVFASTVQPFSQFFAELKLEAHPPLHYLALRLVVPRSDSLLWPRLASIVPAIATIVLTFLCAREMRMTRMLALLAALAFAVAPAHVNIAVCVRAYSLATALTMLAYFFYLRMLRDPRRADTLGCAAAAVLAMATEYSAGLAVVAGLVVLVLLSLLPNRSPPAGTCWSALRIRTPELLLLATGTAALAAYHHWTKITPYGHLSDLFPALGQNRAEFALQGIAGDLTSLLWPLQFQPNGPLVASFALFMTAVGALTVRYLASPFGRQDLLRASALLIHTLLWILLFALSCARLYPFGGRLRHQFVLFPFLLFSIFLLLDEQYRAMPARLLRVLLVLAVGLLIATASWRGLETPLEEFPGERFWETEIATVRAALHPGEAIYVSRYNQVGVFANMRDWRWVHRERTGRRYDRFTVKRDGECVAVIRDSRLWAVPLPPTPTFVSDMASLLRATGRDTLWILALPYGSFDRASADSPASEAALASLCAMHGLTLDGRLVFPEGIAFRVRVRGSRTPDDYPRPSPVNACR